MSTTTVIIVKLRKYWTVKLRMETSYGIHAAPLYQKFATYDEAKRYAETVAAQNAYGLELGR